MESTPSTSKVGLSSGNRPSRKRRMVIESGSSGSEIDDPVPGVSPSRDALSGLGLGQRGGVIKRVER